MVLKWRKRAVYPTLDTRGIDVFVAQTPYPGRVTHGTALVVRYHDALPLFMPHAFANMARHHAAHWHALQSNVDSGAYFACVSEATRQGLLKVFPEVARRSVTIHNMVSPHYFDESSMPSGIPGIIRARVNTQMPGASPVFRSLGEQEDFYRQHVGSGDQQLLKYLLMVSTIEPRKNHLCLLAAWQALRVANDPALKLVLVGSPGWDVEPIMREMRPFIDQGALFVLSGVPASDLRALYKHAQVTVCPSLAEGFDFAGIEAMCSGGVVLASDIEVHREVYANAARYFSPYSAQSLQRGLQELLYSPHALVLQNDLRHKALEVTPLYTQEALLPQWQALLDCAASRCMTSDPEPAT
jgi:glycosyltransferase involved in cell wall biosynthesis